MGKFSLKYIIENPGQFDGWLYLPSQPWTLDTEGFFYKIDQDISPDDERKVRAEYGAQGWQSTLSNEDIEDVLAYCQDVLDNPTTNQLLESLVFYFENDAFKDWGAE